MTGRLILSLDYELMWGVRDHRTIADYGDAVLGARQAIPAMLDRFGRGGIRATWATVGLLFARDRDEMLDHAPRLRPTYDNMDLSPYAFLENGTGRNEEEDPWHFGRSLLDRIADTEGQDIGSQTFSHYYCLEPGQTLEQLNADLAAARTIADEAGYPMRSIVFPRNQMSDAHIAASVAHGIDVVRGTPSHILYRSRAQRETTLPLRAVRFADGALPIARGLDFAEPTAWQGGTDVPASRFLRPYMPKARLYSWLHVRRVCKEMELAARQGCCYHLWWHPHNMGRNIAENLAQLDTILTCFQRLRDDFGMQSCSMTDLALPLIAGRMPEH